MDFLEKAPSSARYVNPLRRCALFDARAVALRAAELFVGEYGLITMGLTYAFAIVLPIVGTFFLAFGLLEDSGYLPRLAIMSNRVFRLMGLNGKAVLPMVLGLGCDTMATMTARILETRKERIIVTLLLALGVPCSAQLGVILGLADYVSLGGFVLDHGGRRLDAPRRLARLAPRAGRPVGLHLRDPAAARCRGSGTSLMKTWLRVAGSCARPSRSSWSGTLALFLAAESGAARPGSSAGWRR